MNTITRYPLQWPMGWQRTIKPQRAGFSCTFGSARDGIFSELRLMKAQNIILSTNVVLSERTVLPYANSKPPADTGVAVYFDLFGKQQCIPCDRWNTVEHNMRAIEKTVNALRGIERWGAKDMVKASFAGFAALPSPKQTVNTTVQYFADCIDSGQARQRYLRLAKELHPDLHPDSLSEFQEMKRQYEAFVK